MVWSPPSEEQLIPVIVSSTWCLVLISVRCIHRALFRCRWHTNCFRHWHREDTLMAVSLVFLAARAACISTYVELGSGPLSDTASGSTSSLDHDRVIARKIVLPARIFYALFLWWMKLCLLEFYSRLSAGISSFERAASILRVVLVLTFVAILFPTLLECRPISLYWNDLPQGDRCRQARANLITMGVFNIATDVALILFPLPLVWKPMMSPRERFRLFFLFSVGLLVVIITIVRLPITLQGSVPQRIRSLWADIEIACACLVANASFYYPAIKEMIKGHPVAPDGGPRRNPLSQQWEISRQPSCPSSGHAGLDLEYFAFDVDKPKLAKPWQEDSLAQTEDVASVVHLEALPSQEVLDTLSDEARV